MTKDIKIPDFKDLDKMLYDRVIEKAKDAFIH